MESGTFAVACSPEERGKWSELERSAGNWLNSDGSQNGCKK